MVNEYEWQDDFNIGVESIDREHRQLFSIINKLLRLKKEGRDSSWVCQQGITFFKTHVQVHFENEEKYMTSIQHEGLEQHRKIHNGFRKNTLPSLERELEQSEYSPKAVEHFLGVCAGWLISHTLTDDMAITGKYDTLRWKYLLTDDMQENMKRMVIQLIFDMFHLEAHIISDTYGGETFGNGIYIRFIFGIPGQKEKVEIFLAFDEMLVLGTIGKILGLSTNKLDNMLFHSIRHFGRQFVRQAIASFPALKDYHLEGENLLSYDEFYELMKKGEQQISFLLDTEEGYFAYCVVAPHLLETDIGTSIAEENAAAEVEAFLNQRRQEEENAAAEMEEYLNRRKQEEKAIAARTEESLNKYRKEEAAIAARMEESLNRLIQEEAAAAAEMKAYLSRRKKEANAAAAEEEAYLNQLRKKEADAAAEMKAYLNRLIQEEADVTAEMKAYLSRRKKEAGIAAEEKDYLNQLRAKEADIAVEAEKYLNRLKRKADDITVEMEVYLNRLKKEKDDAAAGESLDQRKEAEEKKSCRRKVLVVDDSVTMCEKMRLLLSEDYDVSTVDSGAAAIRFIVSNHPDLVLLDYEMPICDGRQTLEIIRSAKAFESVPVMFLTGRTDTNTVVSVMHLKPAGYLLKTSDPQYIKNTVDKFFFQKDMKK